MIEVRLFGDLRRYAGDAVFPSGVAVHLSADGGRTVAQVLTQLGIEPHEVGNIFINGRLLPRSDYPITLGYPLAVPAPLSPEGYLTAPVGSGDRIGIFPTNMAMFVV